MEISANNVVCWSCFLVFLSAWATIFGKAAPIASPGCPSQCGNVTVPYPFGIGKGSGCAYDSGFEILCDTDSNPPRAFLDLEMLPTIVHDITDKEIRIPSPGVATNCYNSTGALIRHQYYSWSLSVHKYCHYSLSQKNKLFTVGCDDTLVISDGTNSTTGCTSGCSDPAHVPDNGSCSGTGCCQFPIPKGSDRDYDVSMVSAWNHTKVWSFNPCGHAFLGDASRFRFLGVSDLSNNVNFRQRVMNSVPLVLDWAIGNLSCKEAENNTGYLCQANSHCLDLETGLGGYRCSCDLGYEGNPYLSPGCTDIDECANPEMNPCEQICINVQGGYNCSCPEGYYGDGKKNGQGCFLINKKSIFPWRKLFIGIGLGVIVLVATATSLCYTIKKRNGAKLRLKFFEQNGGFLLKQNITTSNDNEGADVTKIYSAKELREATNNYAHDMILGRGGNGTVFKGILPNQLKVAVKRSKTVDDSQIEQFINEVVILSRINHRHVVKFLGCCLEAEVPLLVYEYISNGTLHHHIHHEIGSSDWLSWENRLRIAIEAAGALAYLHSAASMPIIHRDVKSTNILLDETYATKISDFGASRLVPLDRTHVATLVQGTLGYLDPEYFQTSRLTEKSDVYSFGVVLAELLTERKPVSPNYLSEEEDRNLSAFFVRAMNENRLFQIIVPRLVREATLDQLQRIAELVKRCLQVKGEDRPKMKEVASELECIKNLAKCSWAEPSCFALEDEPSDLYAVAISP